MSRSPSPRRRSPSPRRRSPSPRRHSPSPRRGSPPRRASRSPPPRSPGGEPNDGCNIFVAQLAFQSRETDLERLFSQYGDVAECRIVVDPNTQRSRGFAFLRMKYPEDAEKAIKALDHYEFDGRAIVVQPAKRRGAHAPTPGQGYQGHGGARPGGSGCYTCGEQGHFARECPNGRGGGGGGYGGPPRGGGYGGPPRGGYADRYDDRDRGYGAPPPRYDDRRGGYDDRRGGYDDRRGGYDDRRDERDDRRYD